MRFFRRTKDIISSNINSTLDKMENPRKMIRYNIVKMENAVDEAKENCAETETKLNSGKEELSSLNSSLSRWEDRARVAVCAHKEELAREAIAEKINISNQIKVLEEEIRTLENISNSQKSQISRLEEKLQQMKAKENSLIARAEHAKQSIKAQETLKQTDCSEIIRSFEILEEKIGRLEAQSNAICSLDHEQDFVNLENQSRIDEELDAIRRSITA